MDRTGMTWMSSEPEARGELLLRRARAALAVGRHQDAVDSARRAHRVRGVDAARLALAEADALLSLKRHREAASLAGRALRRHAGDADLAARLRLVRGQALWMSGRTAAGRAEAVRAAGLAEAPLTHARAHELLGLFDRTERRLPAAGRHASAAGELYRQGQHANGLARALGQQAALQRDAGRVREALALASLRIDIAATTTRLDDLALAHHDRGALLAAFGRWDEARTDIATARDLLRRLSDPREHTLAGAIAAELALAGGDVPAARDVLVRARELLELGADDPAALAEVRLRLSDVWLAEGAAEESEREAAQALRLFNATGRAHDAARGRMRRAHALSVLARHGEALREARRALRDVADGPADLRALGEVTLGRALLRTQRGQAAEAFARAARIATERRWMSHLARVGSALATGAASGAIDHGVDALRGWGHRRLLSLCLEDVSQVLGRPYGGDALQDGRRDPEIRIGRALPIEPGAARELSALARVSVAMAAEGPWSGRWAAAMCALGEVVEWCAAAVIGRTGWRLEPGRVPSPLAGDDALHGVALADGVPHVLDPVANAEGARGRAALVVAIDQERSLYVEFAGGPASPAAAALVREAAAVMGAHPDDAEPPAEAAPPAFPGIVGRCAPMQALLSEMARVAASDVAVHVFGETGTGKERVARALHLASRRRRGPFVAFNASALSDELFEAELFGHARGAFTGAVAAREGYAAEARGGTLFIDELADLSSRGQAKLLRLVQEGEYRRVGETELRQADLRIVSAANKRLAERVAAGLFREDLMYRLIPVTLELPPLRERGDDLLALARHFVRAACARAGRDVPALPADVARALSRYPWPGNIRELENEIIRLVALAGAGPLRVEDLSARLRAAGAAGHAARPGSLREAQAAFERDFVARSLGRHGGCRVRAAEELGITRQALLEKTKRLGL